MYEILLPLLKGQNQGLDKKQNQILHSMLQDQGRKCSAWKIF